MLYNLSFADIASTISIAIAVAFSVMAAIGAALKITGMGVVMARKPYWLNYDGAYIADAQITSKHRHCHLVPMFDEAEIVATCKGVEYVFRGKWYYRHFELGQTVKLMSYQGYDWRGRPKRRCFDIEEK